MANETRGAALPVSVSRGPLPRGGRQARASFIGRTAITGVGYTCFSRKSGVSIMSLAVEAGRAAMTDAGLTAEDIDGIVSYSLYNDSVAGQAVSNALGMPRLRYALDLNLGGQAPCFAVMNAAMAIGAGIARNILVFRALNGRSGLRIGSARYPAPSAQYRYPIGLTAYPQYVAMWIRRYLIEAGLTSEDLADVVIAQRRYASLNDRAVLRKPITREEYLAQPYIVDPLRLADCTIEVDGACAVIVTSTDAAKAASRPHAVISGAAWATGTRPGADVADILAWPDYSRNCSAELASDLWASSDLTPSEVDFAELYDCFSGVVYMSLEGLGLAPRAKAIDLVRSGGTWLDGFLPVNTHGGLLCEGYVHGMNTLVEAVLQLKGRAGARQVPRARSCVVTSGALMDGSALVLTAS